MRLLHLINKEKLYFFYSGTNSEFGNKGCVVDTKIGMSEYDSVALCLILLIPPNPDFESC